MHPKKRKVTEKKSHRKENTTTKRYERKIKYFTKILSHQEAPDKTETDSH